MRADTVGSLLETIRSGDAATAKRLLLTQQYTEIDNQNSRKDGTPLFWCCCQGYRDLVEVLLLNGADVNKATSWGATPLHACVDNNRVDIMTLLLQYNADVDGQTKNGDTALHLASYRGHAQCVKSLVEKGADVDIRNKKRQTPITEAYSGGHYELYRYLKAVKNLYRTRNKIHSTDAGKRNPTSVRPEFESSSDGRSRITVMGAPYCSDISDHTLDSTFTYPSRDVGAIYPPTTSGNATNFRLAQDSTVPPSSNVSCHRTNGNDTNARVLARRDLTTGFSYSNASHDVHLMHRMPSFDEDSENKGSVIGVLRLPHADYMSGDFLTASSADSSLTNDLSSSFVSSGTSSQMTFKNI